MNLDYAMQLQGSFLQDITELGTKVERMENHNIDSLECVKFHYCFTNDPRRMNNLHLRLQLVAVMYKITEIQAGEIGARQYAMQNNQPYFLPDTICIFKPGEQNIISFTKDTIKFILSVCVNYQPANDTKNPDLLFHFAETEQ